MQRLLFVIVAFLVSCAPSSAKDLGNSVVKITYRSAGGTGFFIKTPHGDTLVLTNKHVCKLSPEGKLRLDYEDGAVYQGTVEALATDYDLCVVSTRIVRPALEMADLMFPREHVTVMGHPHLEPLTISEGYLVKRQSINMLLGLEPDGSCDVGLEPFPKEAPQFCKMPAEVVTTSVIVFPGNSGSPVLDDDGRVVGIISVYDQDTHYGDMVPMDLIQKFLVNY